MKTEVLNETINIDRKRRAFQTRRAFTVGAQKFDISVIISLLISSYLCHSNRKDFVSFIDPQAHNEFGIVILG